MPKTIIWLLLLGIAVSLISLIIDSIEPFIISFVLAYILYPVIDKATTRYHLPRNAITYGIFIVFMGGIFLLLFLLSPLIYAQFTNFITKIPTYHNYLQTELLPLLTAKLELIDKEAAIKFENAANNVLKDFFNTISKVFYNLWQYTMATINTFLMILVIPFITLYLLKDWPQITNTIEDMLPKKEKSKIRQITAEIGEVLSAYIRGQLNVCVLIAIFYAAFLSLIGLDFGLLIGIITGFAIIIPFIGTFLSLTVSCIIGYFNFGLTIKFAYLLGIYLVGHLLESYILAPKVIGDKIGLHPLWIIFSIFVFGSLFGFIGILLAVPIAAVTKVLLIHLVNLYKNSSLYND